MFGTLVAHHNDTGKIQPVGPPLSWKSEPPSLHTFSGKTIKRAYLAAAYRNSLSCFCVLELYFDVDWHGVALLLFVLCFHGVAKLSASTARIVNIFCSRHRFFLWDN